MHGVDDQLGLSLPTPVERGLARPSLAGDGVEGELVVADVDEQPDGRVEDLLLALTGDPWPTGSGDSA
jgi:hypothetical protein